MFAVCIAGSEDPNRTERGSDFLQPSLLESFYSNLRTGSFSSNCSPSPSPPMNLGTAAKTPSSLKVRCQLSLSSIATPLLYRWKNEDMKTNLAIIFGEDALEVEVSSCHVSLLLDLPTPSGYTVQHCLEVRDLWSGALLTLNKLQTPNASKPLSLTDSLINLSFSIKTWRNSSSGIVAVTIPISKNWLAWLLHKNLKLFIFRNSTTWSSFFFLPPSGYRAHLSSIHRGIYDRGDDATLFHESTPFTCIPPSDSFARSSGSCSPGFNHDCALFT